MTPRLADGAAAALVGRGDRGPRVRAIRWHTDGSSRFSLLVRVPGEPTDARARPGGQPGCGKALSVRRPGSPRAASSTSVSLATAREVLEVSGWRATDLDLMIVDYVVPTSHETQPPALGVAAAKTIVPTAAFGHVMTGGSRWRSPCRATISRRACPARGSRSRLDVGRGGARAMKPSEGAVRRTHFLGIGSAVPDRVVTNEDLSARMDTSDEWIQQRTGIRERRHVTEECGATDLGTIAAERALERAGRSISDIDADHLRDSLGGHRVSRVRLSARGQARRAEHSAPSMFAINARDSSTRSPVRTR